MGIELSHRDLFDWIRKKSETLSNVLTRFYNLDEERRIGEISGTSGGERS